MLWQFFCVVLTENREILYNNYNGSKQTNKQIDAIIEKNRKRRKL